MNLPAAAAVGDSQTTEHGDEQPQLSTAQRHLCQPTCAPFANIAVAISYT